MEIKLEIPYNREHGPMFNLDDFLIEVEKSVESVRRLDDSAIVRLSGVKSADNNNLGVGISVGSQRGYTVPDATILQVTEEREPASIDRESEKEYPYLVTYKVADSDKARTLEKARASLEADLGGQDIEYRIENEEFASKNANCVEFKVYIPGSETGNLTVPHRIFTTAEEIRFGEKEDVEDI
jgi:hypothetical protein